MSGKVGHDQTLIDESEKIVDSITWTNFSAIQDELNRQYDRIWDIINNRTEKIGIVLGVDIAFIFGIGVFGNFQCNLVGWYCIVMGILLLLYSFKNGYNIYSVTTFDIGPKIKSLIEMMKQPDAKIREEIFGRLFESYENIKKINDENADLFTVFLDCSILGMFLIISSRFCVGW